MKSAQTQEDVAGLMRYIDLKENLTTRLDSVLTSNEFIQSVYFYNEKKKLVFVRGGMQYDLASFYDTAWLADYETTTVYQY